MLFTRKLTDWNSWGAVFQSIEVFEPLAREILRREGLPAAKLTNLEPGTHAVFRAGEHVVKIFAPDYFGDFVRDYDAELDGMRRAEQAGVRATRALAHGSIEDAYTFRYMIIDYHHAEMAGAWLKKASPEQRMRLAEGVRAMTERLHRPERGEAAVLLRQFDENQRWAKLPRLRDALRPRVLAMEEADCVFVHGDMTSENLLVDADGEPILIDFADSKLAPACYEMPPLVFDLFLGHPDAARALYPNMTATEWTEKLTTGIALHDFGADIIAHAHRKLRGGEMPDCAEAMRGFLAEYFGDCTYRGKTNPSQSPS